MSLLSSEELQSYIRLVDQVPASERQKIVSLLDMDRVQRCRDDFMVFVSTMWPGFIAGQHHRIMADAFKRVVDGSLKRLIINMPPRHTKSEFASFLLPAWYLGKFPGKKIIQSSHTAELAVGFGRKVRNLVATDQYRKVFDTELSVDSKAAGRWNTSVGGEYFAIGVGGNIAGKGGDLVIIDDPHSEQEAMQANSKVFDSAYEWFTSGPRQRLQPHGAIIVVMCMTGDTNVLMADKTQKKLRDIRPGDEVATYEAGCITTSKINNWQSSGVDSIVSVQTQSGIILRANKKHPFLVEWRGERKWARLEDLIPGMSLVATMDASGLQGHKPNPDSVPPAKPETATTGKTLTHRLNPSEVMGGGLESSVNAANQYPQRDCALLATASSTHQSPRQNNAGAGGLKTAMDSHRSSMSGWLQTAKTSVMSVVNRLRTKIHGRTGTAGSASTIATKQESFAAYSATIATLLSDTERFQRLYEGPLSTYSVTIDQIISISPSGEEEVFDIEVDRTENFIANGVVSHNTRWSTRDLTGQILKNSRREATDNWEVIEFPALLPSGNPLWPGFWPKELLESLKAELPVGKWNAQYQQNPVSEQGAIIKRDQWKIWQREDPPDCEYLIQSWDTAFEKKTRSDYSACTTWGIFYRDGDDGKNRPNIILLDAYKNRMEFPELKQKALEMFKYWNPDTLIVEKRAAGSPLIYELRKIGIPLSEYTPSKGHDKVARLNACSDLFASGVVWRPETRWADEVVEEMAAFPNGDNDDLVDSSSQALLRFRQGGFISILSDEEDEPIRKRRHAYY